LLGWRAKSRSGFCLPSVAVSANINAPAAVAGHALPDALPRLDFSPSGKPSGRASRLARSFAFALWADDTTLYRFLQRLDEDPVARGLGETVRRLRRGKTQVRVSCAIDGTGVSPHAVRTYFLRRSEQQNGGKSAFGTIGNG